MKRKQVTSVSQFDALKLMRCPTCGRGNISMNWRATLVDIMADYGSVAMAEGSVVMTESHGGTLEILCEHCKRSVSAHTCDLYMQTSAFAPLLPVAFKRACAEFLQRRQNGRWAKCIFDKIPGNAP